MSNKVHWNLNSKDIKNILDNYITDFNKLIEKILNLPKNKQTFSNTFKEFNKYINNNHFKINMIIFLQNIIDDEDILNASVEAEKTINEYNINFNMRNDLYNLAKKIWNEENKSLIGEDLIYLQDILKAFHRNGVELDKQSQEQLKSLNTELSNLCTEYSINIAKDSTTIQLTKEELDGLPELFFNNLDAPINEDELGGGDVKMYTLTAKYPHVFPILEKATNEETRKKVEIMFNSRCKENMPILFRIIQLRQQIASLLGYKTWADYVLEENMANTPNKVSVFLSKLSDKLKVLREKELKIMESKKGDIIYQYDWRYYLDQEIIEKYKVDSDIIREYFQLENVLKHMLSYFEKIFELKFVKNNNKLWHPDVQEWEVYNNKDNIPIGKFYFDLFPRNNKFSHAACFSLKYATVDAPYCICAMLCNFNSPSNDIPSLLSHNEVETLYHEFGHVMHNICSKTYYVEYSGTQTERDFIEAPSQMLENWCWEFSTIKELSSHYKTNKKMPDNMINKLIATRYVGSGLINCRQLTLGITDQLIHTQNIDNIQNLEDIYNKISNELMGIPSNSNTYNLATFGHIAGGYDAQYYGYMWSKVYAEDMYVHFKELNSKGGIQFRKKVLEKGGSIDAIELVYDFLGRDVDNTAFLKRLGL